MITRRQFASQAALASYGLLAGNSWSIEPFQRLSPMIKGLGLAAYSLRQQMRYAQGKEGPGKMDLLDFLEFCAELRLEVAELTAYFFPPEIKPEYLRELRRRAHILGLDLSSGAIGNNFSHIPGSDKAKEQLNYVFKWLDHYSDLGVSVIRIFAGTPSRGTAIEDAIKTVLANLEPALAYAERRGVLLAMENHDFTTNVDHLLSIVKAVNSKWFGALLDSGNLQDSKDPYADLAKIAPYALSAQVKTSIPMNGKKEATDFGRIIRVLNEAGYAGYLVLEYEDEEDPYVAIPRHLRALRRGLVENLPGSLQTPVAK